MFSAFLFISPAFSATLPSGYTELEYIESSGTQYIDLGDDVYFQTGSIIEVDYQITANNTQSAGWQAIYGNGRVVNWPGYICSYALTLKGNKQSSYYYNGYNDVSDSSVDLNRHTIRQESERFYRDGNLVYTRPTSTFTNKSHIWLFSRLGSTDLNMVGKIYGAKVWSDGTELSFNGVPVQNINGETGLYDTVSGRFFGNSGTGTFTAGPAVLPCGYTRLEYIESGGTQYIDTGVYADKNTEVEMVVKTNGPGSQYLFGSSDGVERYMLSQRRADDCLTFDFVSTTNRIPSSIVGYDDFHKIEIKNQSFYVDDFFVGSFASVDNFTPRQTSYIFDAKASSWSDTGSKIKYLKIWQSGALVRDYIPAKDPDGVIGMYDSVSGDFFPNAETKYTQVEYLKSSGTQYIEDTSFTTINTGAIEIKTKDLTPHARFVGWGAGNNYLQVSAALATPNSETNFFPFCYSNSWNDVNNRQADITAENVIRYEFSPGLQKLYVNGIFDRQGTASGSVSTYPFRLFKVSLDTSVLDGYGAIYYCKVFNDVGALVRHYIPVRRDSDGVLGMYDTTTRAFLQNVGTGTFTAGADLDTFPNSFIAGPEIATNNSNCQVVNINWGGLSEPEASGMCVYGETFTAPSITPTAAAGYKFLGWRPI